MSDARDANSVPTIVLVEDSQDDAYFFQRALKKSGVVCEVKHFWDGGAVVEWLREVTVASGPLPQLLFLDLKMPVMTGFDVLTWIGGQRFAGALPVIILSGSDQQSDQQRARELGAAEFLVKPITASCLADRLKKLVPVGPGV